MMCCTNSSIFTPEQRKSERGSVSLKPLNLKGKTDKESSFLKAASAGKVEKLQSSIKARKVRWMKYKRRQNNVIGDVKRRNSETVQLPLPIRFYLGMLVFTWRKLTYDVLIMRNRLR